MCGINGVLHKNNQPVNEELLIHMRDKMIHRGPDDAGILVNNCIGLGHRRLSILDTSYNGHQPRLSKDGRYAIVFNGEIYNFEEFKPELAAKGYIFTSESDTEVLLYLYIEYGESMLNRLNGMFAFAIWDNQVQELFIARDRLGVKPLYFYNSDLLFAFASEPKALFAYGIEKLLDPSQLNEWLLYRYVSGANTLYKNIFSLLPGYTATLSKKNNFTIQLKRWWNLSEKINNHTTIKNPTEWFKDTFLSSINYRMISDVPVGILLSGGLDSSSVAAAVHQNGFTNINTFNVGFPGFIDDESAKAAAFSEKLGFNFHSISITGNDFYDNLVKSTYIHNEPLTHHNDPQLLGISKYSKQFVTVLLSGEGSDELMAGYVRYNPLKYLQYANMAKGILKLIPTQLKNNRLKKLENYLQLKNTTEQILYNASGYYPQDYEMYGIDTFCISNTFRYDIAKEAKELFPNNILRQTLYTDQHTYLCSLNTRNDRASMAASIECREPFLDYRLIEGIGSLPDKWFIKNGNGKQLLRESMASLLGQQALSFRKIGFSIPWLQLVQSSEQLTKDWNTFHLSEIFEQGILANLNIAKIKADYEAGDKSKELLIRQLFMLAFWYKHSFQNIS
jgi:asparagine synthase (glutamine-hydrolysing)